MRDGLRLDTEIPRVASSVRHVQFGERSGLAGRRWSVGSVRGFYGLARGLAAVEFHVLDLDVLRRDDALLQVVDSLAHRFPGLPGLPSLSLRVVLIRDLWFGGGSDLSRFSYGAPARRVFVLAIGRSRLVGAHVLGEVDLLCRQ